MSLSRLKATHFRNLISLDLEPGSQFNLISGTNGSGKTSILEAIYFLGMGRSFRSHITSRIISYGAPGFLLFGTLTSDYRQTIGIEKIKNGKTQIKVAGEKASSAAELAKLLPVQLINPDSYELLNSGPRHRREFLDWGMFHVEHFFFPVWQRYQRALKQRNAALQQMAPKQQLIVWDAELVSAAIELAKLRQQYFDHLVPVVKNLLAELLNIKCFSFSLNPGWDAKRDLVEVLRNSYERDIAVGYTQYGPQRADLEIRVNDMPVEDVLSRGEQKVLVCALRLAQGILMQRLANKSCIYLLDDLAAELDKERRGLVAKVLADLKTQVFVTTVDPIVVEELQSYAPAKMFHVKHGNLVSVI